MRKIFSLLVAALVSASMLAGVETTVYYTAPEAVIGSYTVKLNVNFKGDGDDWHTYIMTKTDLTYHETDPVYSCTFTDDWSGLGVMQIQLYNGEEWISQEQPFNTWTNAYTYNGKLWVHGGNAWVELSGEEIDPTISIKGGWDGWTSTPLVLSDNKETASVTIAMSEGIYEFGLELNGSFIANGATITRAANTSSDITGNTGNMKLNVDADGDYIFTWTFATNTLAVTYPDAVVVPAKFYITGDAALVGESLAWNASAIKVTEDSYTFENLSAGDYQLKVTLNGLWEPASDVKGYSDLTVVADGLSTDASNNINFTLAEAGNVTVTYTADPAVFKLEGNFEAYVPTLTNGYYLVGSMNSWGPAAGYLFVENGSAPGEYKLENITLVKDAELKVAYVENDATKTWYGENNYVVDEDHAGVKTLYFNPAKGEGWTILDGYLWIDANEPSALGNTEVGEKAQKMIDNGQLVIIKNGKSYNVLGAEIR